MEAEERTWKELFETFFADLLEHLAPDLRGQLYFEGAFCLELAALDLGFEREAAEHGFVLAAEVPHQRDGSRLVLVQVETRPGPRSRIEARLERSFRRLCHGLRRPVLPLVVHLAGSAPSGHRCLVRGDAGVELFRLDYRSVNLACARAESHLGRSRLAPALAARMRSERWSRLELQLECMAAVLASELDAERQSLLLRAIEVPWPNGTAGSGGAVAT